MSVSDGGWLAAAGEGRRGEAGSRGRRARMKWGGRRCQPEG